MTYNQIVDKLVALSPTTKAVVISGGEPLLQQRQLGPLLEILKGSGYWIEVETNGTIAPIILDEVDQINCSPKLANSGDPIHLREREGALQVLSASSKVSFKFVVSSPTDIDEILHYVAKYKMKEVYLMPEGRTREDLAKHTGLVEELCRVHGFKFTQRLHIIKFGAKRGV